MDNRAPHVSQTISEKNLPIYGKDGPIKKAIESVFQYALKWITLLIANDHDAVKKVLEIKQSNPREKLIIVIFDDFINLLTTEEKSDIMRLMKFPNTRTTTEHVTNIVADIIKNISELNDMSITQGGEVLSMNNIQKRMSQRILGTLQHDLKPYVIEQKWEPYKKILSTARDAFDIKPETPDENVVSFILNTKTSITKVMNGEITGVYCDIDDTIFDQEWALKNETLELIQRLESEGNQITIWTGWDLAIATKRLEKTPYTKYPLVSKHDYAGATAEIIIDNVSPEKFFIQSGISAKKFIRV